MRICVDARCLMEGRKTGVEEYTLSLLLNLLEIDQKNQYVLFLNSRKDIRFDFSVLEKFSNVKIKRFRIPNKILNFSFWYFGFPKIDRLVGGADVVFFPNIFFGSVNPKTKTILTIHDLSFERYPESFSLKRRLWHLFINPKKLCESATKILAVSDSTKKDIQSIYKIPENKIIKILSAVSDKFRIIDRNNGKLLEIKEKYNLPFKFILYFGAIEPRKNIIALVQAFEEFKKNAKKEKDKELARYKLVIAGERGWSDRKIFEKIESFPYRDDIQIVNSVCEEDKVYFYNLASLFVFPSFFEGFGFPPLEAMRCGVPTVASNNSSLSEVVGNGGILIDPDKPDEIQMTIKEVLKNRELKEVLIKKGLEKSKEFDWKKTASGFLEVLSEFSES